jgi:hypothetical protein
MIREIRMKYHFSRKRSAIFETLISSDDFTWVLKTGDIPYFLCNYLTKFRTENTSAVEDVIKEKRDKNGLALSETILTPMGST